MKITFDGKTVKNVYFKDEKGVIHKVVNIYVKK